MRKWSLIVVLAIMTTLGARETEKTVPVAAPNKPETSFELKIGYFSFSDSKMRKIYNRGGLDLQLCGSLQVWRWLHLYGSVEYLERSGKSLNGGQKTRIEEIPLSLGLKPVWKITPRLQGYLAIGPRYFFVYTHNSSNFADSNLHQSGLGAFAGFGLQFFPYKQLLIDLFVEYSYKRLHFHSSLPNVTGQKVQIGGYACGVGVGYKF